MSLALAILVASNTLIYTAVDKVPEPYMPQPHEITAQIVYNEELTRMGITHPNDHFTIYRHNYNKVVCEDSSTKKTSEETPKQDKYTSADLDMLARLINAEAGSSWISDEWQQHVGMVVLNRVKSDKFPNTIKDVIYAKGQYACVKNGSFKKAAPQRAIDNAKAVLEGKCEVPSDVVWQAEFKQGKGVYKKFYNEYTGNYTYFCQ